VTARSVTARRLAAALLALASACAAAAPVGSGDEPETAGRTPEPAVTEQDLAAMRAERARYERERAERRDAPGAAEDRARTRSRYRGMGRSEAIALARSRFGPSIESDVWPGVRVRPGERVERLTGTHGALIALPNGLNAVAESNTPLQVRGDDGELEPVELALDHEDGRYAPRRPIVPIEIRAGRAAQVAFERSGIGIRLAGAADRLPEAEEVADRVFFSSVAPDTDAWVTPTPGGVELFHQLRSPEELPIGLDLPTGATVRLSDAGFATSAEVVRDGERIAAISPPRAVDSDGEPVPVEMAVSDRGLTLRVTHRAADLRYPILVDPAITEKSYWDDDGWTIGQRGWGGYAADWSKWVLQLTAWELGHGLYISSKPDLSWTAGEYAQWYLNTHRAGVHFPRVEFATRHRQMTSTCVRWGIWDYRSSWWSAERLRCEWPSDQESDSTVLCVASDCNWEAGPDGGAAIYKLIFYANVSNGSGSNTPPSSHAVLRSAVVYLWDNYPPGFINFGPFGSRPWAHDDSVSVGGWGKDAISAGGEDIYGIGMSDVELSAPGLSGGHTVKAPTCDGTRHSPCNETVELNATVASTPSTAQGVRPVEVRATEYIGRTSVRQLGSLRIDRTPPNASPLKGTLLGGGVQPSKQYTLEVAATDSYSGVQSAEVAIDGKAVPGAKHGPGCTRAAGCATDYKHTFTIDTTGMSYGTHTVAVTIRDPIAGELPAQDGPDHRVTPTATFEITDGDAPRLKTSGSLRNPFAVGNDLTIEASDDGSGVAKTIVWVDPDADPSEAEAASAESHCNPGCPPAVTRGFALPATTAEGKHELLVRAVDAAGKSVEERWDVYVVSLRPGLRSKLGLEQWFTYDETDAGGDSRVYVNGETGNAIWHSTPIVNPGRGLSTVVNLTYNSQDRGALLGSLLGRNPVAAVDPNPLLPEQERLGDDLPGLSFAEAGVGFSLGVSGPTRLNEPLGGVLAAGDLEEGTNLLGRPLDPLRPTEGLEITLTDADGTVHRFTKAGGRWVAPPGVNMHLRRYKPGGTLLEPIADKWALTRPDGVTHFFDNLGYLRSTVDRNGNQLTYVYETYDAFTGVGPCSPDSPVGRLIGTQTPAGGTLYSLCAKRVVRVTDPAGRNLEIDYVDQPLLQQPLAGMQVNYPLDFPGVVGGTSGRIDKITDHAGRVYDFEYDDHGYLKKLVEAANRPRARVTRFEYEPRASGAGAIGQDRHMTAIVELHDANGDGTISDAEERARTTIAYPERASTVPGGTLRRPRRASAITTRAGGGKTYVDAPPAGGEPRKFDIVERLGGARSATTRYELDDAGRPTAMVDPLQSRTEIGWLQGENKPHTITEAAGSGDEARTELEYHTQTPTGMLKARTTYPSWPQTEGSRRVAFDYRFGPGKHLSTAAGVDDRNGTFVADLTLLDNPVAGTDWTFTPDDRGNVVRQTDAKGNFVERIYDAFGQVTQEIDENGDATAYPVEKYHATGQPGEVRDPRQSVWTYLYDAVGNVRAVVDPRATDRAGARGNPYTTTLTYDAFDRLVEEHVPKLSQPPPGQSPDFVTRSTEYDRNGNVVASTDGEGKRTTVEYTAADNPRTVRRPGSNGDEVTTYVYDDADRLIARLDPKGSPGDAEAARTTHAAACTQEASPQPLAYVTRFCLDDDGRRVADIRHSTRPGDTPTLVTSFAYDARDNLVGVVDPKRNSSRTPAAAIAAARTPGERRTSYEYNRVDQQKAVIEQPTELDPDGSRRDPTRWAFHYDANGNRTEIEHPRGGNARTRMTYDHRDTLVAERDPLGNMTCWTRDPAGRVTAETSPRGTGGNLDRCLAVQAANVPSPQAYVHHTTRYEYDDAGDVVSRSVPFAPGQYGLSDQALSRWKVTYERDAVGNPVEITDARGNALAALESVTELERHTFVNAFYDTGQLRTTQRPSFWGLEWNGQPSLPSAGERFERDRDADLEVGVGGPQVVERDGRSANAERSDRDPELPESLGHGDLGRVDPEAMPELLPEAGTVELSYDDELRLTGISMPSASGNDRSLTYDAAGRVRTKTLPFKPGSPLTHAYDYDAHGNLTSLVDAAGAETTFGYDGYDRLVEERAPGSHPTDVAEAAIAELTRFHYDRNDNLRFLETPRGTSTADNPCDYRFEFGYDSLDRLAFEQDPSGSRWSYDYDVTGNRSLETSPRGQSASAGDKELFQTRLGYDDADRLVERIQKVRDGNTVAELKTTFGYDADGNRTRTTAPGAQRRDGSSFDLVTETVYDGRGMRWKESLGTGGEKRWNVTEYDPNGNLRRSVRPRGANASGTPLATDDGSSNPLNLITATKDATIREYDEHDQLVSLRLPWNDADNRRFRQDFRRAGPLRRVQSIVSPYEASDAEAPRTSYTYFDSGWISSVSDQKLQDPQSRQPVESRLVSYDYDEEGRQILWKSKNAGESAAGREIKRTYWPNGLVRTRAAKKTTDPDEAPSHGRYEYLYNRNRSLVRFHEKRPDDADPDRADRATVITRDPSEREHRVNESWRGGRDTIFWYDEAGNVKTRETDGAIQPDGGYGGREARSTRFVYDSVDRETSMTVQREGEGARATTTSYFNSGDVRERRRPSGALERWRYTSRGERSRRERVRKSGSVAETQDYGYDANGNRSQDERGTHAFNARDQLVEWKKNSTTTVTYTLNGDGAITQKEGDGKTTTYVYRGERLISATTGDSRSSYRYDDFGNVVRVRHETIGDVVLPPVPETPISSDKCREVPEEERAETTIYCYDEFERQVFAKGQGVEDPAEFEYDGLDRRDRKIVTTSSGQNVTDYSYIGVTEMLSREKDVSGGKRRVYDYNADGERQGVELTNGEETPRYRAYARDANGTVLGLESQTDADVPEADRYEYDPYGDIANEPTGADAKDNPFRFQGFYYDSGVKSYDMHARHYRPDVGRFLSQDRFASAAGDQNLQSDPLTQNRYAFAGANPVTNVEFDGHEPPHGSFIDNPVRNNPYGGRSGRNVNPRFNVGQADVDRVVIRGRQAARRAMRSPGAPAPRPTGYRPTVNPHNSPAFYPGTNEFARYHDSGRRMKRRKIKCEPQLLCELLATAVLPGGPAVAAGRAGVSGVRAGVAGIRALVRAASTRGADELPDAYAGVREASRYLEQLGLSREIRKDVLESFERGTIRVRRAGSNDYALRLYGEPAARAEGRYLFPTLPAGRASLALPPRNPAVTMAQFRIRPGTIYFQGRVASRFGQPGGGVQYYVPNVRALERIR
jgi:RHS repeat-associated protein